MAIDQVKTISDLERLPELLDAYALAVSTGAATGSATLLQTIEHAKNYLESLTNKVSVLDTSETNYPNCKAVSDANSRIVDIMANIEYEYINSGIGGSLRIKTPDNENGLLIQWNRATINPATFYIPFKTWCEVISCQYGYSGRGDRALDVCHLITLTGFSWQAQSYTGVNYIAIGI